MNQKLARIASMTMCTVSICSAVSNAGCYYYSKATEWGETTDCSESPQGRWEATCQHLQQMSCELFDRIEGPGSCSNHHIFIFDRFAAAHFSAPNAFTITFPDGVFPQQIGLTEELLNKTAELAHIADAFFAEHGPELAELLIENGVSAEVAAQLITPKKIDPWDLREASLDHEIGHIGLQHDPSDPGGEDKKWLQAREIEADLFSLYGMACRRRPPIAAIQWHLLHTQLFDYDDRDETHPNGLHRVLAMAPHLKAAEAVQRGEAPCPLTVKKELRQEGKTTQLPAHRH